MLNYVLVEMNDSGVIVDIEVWAKPGAKMDKVSVVNGILVISTRAKPVDGLANAGICLAVADIFGVSKSRVELIKGEKSRQKKIRLMLALTAGKDIDYYQKKIMTL